MKTILLNLISVIFKSVSLINLFIKSINKKEFNNAFIISIDNLSFGGTGKTPLVIELGKQLLRESIRFSIVLRGYKSRYEIKGKEVEKEDDYYDVGDEAVLYKNYFENNPVFIGKNRINSIKKSIEKDFKVIILDDGFQSSYLKKDLKIMLINNSHPYYFLRNFKFLRILEDIVLYYNENKELKDNEYTFENVEFIDKKGNSIDIENKKIIGFSALGDNKRFKRDLENYNLIEFFAFKDHYSFGLKDMERLKNILLQRESDYLVCSEKDFVKIKHYINEEYPLIYAKNRIKLNLNLIEKIKDYAKRENKTNLLH